VKCMKRIINILKLAIPISTLLLLQHCGITDAEKNAEANFSGKWTLVKSDNPSDTSYLNSSWITLNKDSLFQSNTSFFWNKDSLKARPLNGRWIIQINSSIIYNDQGETTFIDLTADSTTRGWVISGNGTKDGTMFWYSSISGWHYTWTAVN